LAEDVLDLLLRLIDKSLVVAEEGPAGSARYRLLETLRHYARERLVGQGASAAGHRRHAAYYLAFAEQAEPQLRGADQVLWLAWLANDHDNLRAALAWCLEEGAADTLEAERPEAAMGVRLAGALWWFWWLHGHPLEAVQWLERALSQSRGRDGQEPVAARARVLLGAGVMLWDQGSRERGEPLLEESVTDYRRLGDKHGLAHALYWLGLALNPGPPEDRRRGGALLEEAIAVAREAGESACLARALSYLGFSRDLRDHNEAEAARQTAEQGLAVAQQTGDRFSIAWAYRALGQIARVQGDYPRARAAFAADLAQMRALGNRLGIAHTLAVLGDVARLQGDPTSATPYYEECLALDRDLGAFPTRMVEVLRALGELALQRGALAEARERLRESLTIASRLRDLEQVAQVLEALASLAASTAEDKPERALRLAGAAAALRKQSGQPLLPAEPATVMSQLTSVRQTNAVAAQGAAWTEGQAMTLEQAIAYALEGCGDG
jgi:tetratricopeptide (TPR) repeat protein